VGGKGSCGSTSRVSVSCLCVLEGHLDFLPVFEEMGVTKERIHGNFLGGKIP
jgi:hypothetical protein